MADSRTTKSHYKDLADIIRQKKNEEGKTYTPQEIVQEVRNLSGPSGKSVIFRNLDSSGGQHFEVRLTPHGGDTFSQDGYGDMKVQAQFPEATFWVRSHSGYVPGEIDTKSPLNMNEIEEDYVITAQVGYQQPGNGELVDLSNYYSNNSGDCISSSNYYFTDNAKAYLRSIRPTSMYKAFYDCKECNDNYPFLLIDTSECTTMERCFYSADLGRSSTDKVLNLSSWDTAKVTNMTYMFESCDSLTTLDLSSFDTSNVNNMTYMFHGCSSLTTLDLSSFDTSNVRDMSDMFERCSSLITLDLSSFDTSKAITMDSMFRGCSSLTALDLSSFDTSNVGNMIYMFSECSKLTALDLSYFNTSNVRTMIHMFDGCSSLTALDLSSFNISNVDMSYMFYGCTKLTEIKGVIDFHNQSSSSYYRNMFTGCPISSSTPVQIKNPPSAENWWQTAGFTSEDQFEIVT